MDKTSQPNVPAGGGQPEVVVVQVDELRDAVRRTFRAAGADQATADRLAEGLVSSNLAGVETHGVWRVPEYVAAIQAGDVVPTAKPEIVSETPTTALVSGNWNFGLVAAKYATELAIAKAEKQNIAIAGIVKTYHIGRVGEYVEMAAARGMIGQAWAGGFSEEAPAVVPYGGRQRALHTNPLAMSFPAASGPPMMFDFATAAVSGIKVLYAHEQNKPLPPGCIVDKDGNPTTNAADFYEGGGLLPFGMHKGYGLMMAAEFLGMVLTGSDHFSDPQRGGAIYRHSGAVFIVFKPDVFRPLSEYFAQAEKVCTRIRSIPPAPGVKEVLVPGDPEARTRAARLRDGIPLPPEVWRKISELPKS